MGSGFVVLRIRISEANRSDSERRSWRTSSRGAWFEVARSFRTHRRPLKNLRHPAFVGDRGTSRACSEWRPEGQPPFEKHCAAEIFMGPMIVSGREIPL